MALRDVKEIAVPLVLDKPRTLKFDLNAFSELEDKYGSMEQAFLAMQSGSMKAARTLLWAGLLHEDDKLTERQVGGLVTLGNLEEVMTTISNALMDALPDDGEQETQEAVEADPT